MSANKERLTVAQENIISEEHFISKATLLERAATLKGLHLVQNDESFCRSGAIDKFALNESFEQKLIKDGFEIDNKRPDGILTIAFHEKKDSSSPFKLSDYWNIRKGKKTIFVLPEVNFIIGIKDRIILLRPQVNFSDIIVSPASQSVYNKMAETIVSHRSKTPSIFKEMVRNDFKVIIPWKEIDAAGSRTLFQLFNEWVGDNEAIEDLASSNVSPFKPSPHNYDDEKIWYHHLPEQLHRSLFAQWKKQYEEFKNKLP